MDKLLLGRLTLEQHIRNSYDFRQIRFGAVSSELSVRGKVRQCPLFHLNFRCSDSLKLLNSFNL